MKNDFENNNGDKEFGNTLDYYNDELSRKAVGKLFENESAGEMAASSEEPGRGDEGSMPAGGERPAARQRPPRAPREIAGEPMEGVIPVEPPKVEEKPINNHFYEEARAEANENTGGIVQGFEEEGEERPASRPRRPRENGEARELGGARAPRAPGEARGLREPGEARVPREPGEARVPREPGEARVPREPGEARVPREPGEVRGSREPGEARTPRTPGEARASRMAREAEDSLAPRAPRQPREPRENDEAREPGEARAPRTPRERPLPDDMEKPQNSRLRSQRVAGEEEEPMAEGRPAPRRKRDEGTVGSAMEADAGSERDKYRKQFLSDMEKDPRRNVRRKIDEEEQEVEKPSARRTAPRSSAPRSSARGANAQEYPEEFENAEKRYSTRRTTPIRDEDRLYPSQSGGNKRSPYRQPEYPVADKGQNPLSMPIFKVIAVAFVLMLFILVFMIYRLNGASKELKALKEVDATMVTMTQEEYDSVMLELDGLKGEVSRLNTENRNLNLQITDLTEPEVIPPPDGEGEGDGVNAAGNRTYTVAPGDNLSSISQTFYGSANEYNRIMEANGITDASTIRPGTTLIIP